MPNPANKMMSARAIATIALVRAVERFPDLDPISPDTSSLDPRDARLAHAIAHTVAQRWITLEFLLDRHLRQPMGQLEPKLRALFLAAGAQVLFMDRLPIHAVVDESVELAKRLVRPGAGAMVNAVLRKLAGDVQQIVRGAAYSPATDRLPIDDGYVHLASPVLPGLEDGIGHLSIACGVPARLLQDLRLGDPKIGEPPRPAETNNMLAFALHAVRTPLVIVTGVDQPGDEMVPHGQPDFYLWQSSHEALLGLLHKPGQSVRVQDPTSALAVEATRSLQPHTVVDYCAGRGTKTRQLGHLHPSAALYACDTDPRKLSELERSAMRGGRVNISTCDELHGRLKPGSVDLLVLDVPCTNTGVLGRRPEARYRYSPQSVESLVRLQRQIVGRALPLLSPTGLVLYSTCSLDERENHEQARDIAKAHGLQITEERFTLPGGAGATYHDGGYFALIGRA
ncbi:MAG: hypothetical protein GC164_08305 [Phycisphaera sp.]|nr:hypothetical protein [Phycisphaera sp.]